LVVYGVHTVDRSTLQVGQEVEAIVMTLADQKAFAQIKGSYLKIKVKQLGTTKLKPQDTVLTKITKVKDKKLSSELVQLI
jgi:hypothetical protein